MRSHHTGKFVAFAVVALLLCSASARAQLSATATIQGVQNGGAYDYTMKLTNTGSASISTFWFAWTPPGQPVEYDFLPTAPSTAAGPTSWTGYISAGFPGTSIEYYNTGSAGSAIAAGQTGTFTFTSTDSPATLENGRAFGVFPFTESFIYTNAPPANLSTPPTGTAVQVNPAFVVPEPSSIFLGSMGCLFFAARRRRRSVVA